MRSFKPICMLYIIVLALAALGAPTAWAGEVPLSGLPLTGFGTSIFTPGTSPFGPGTAGTLNFTATVDVFKCTSVTGCPADGHNAQAGAGVYSYLYTIQNTGSIVINQISLDGPDNQFDINLNYGFVSPSTGTFDFTSPASL